MGRAYVELMRELYDALGRGDVEAALSGIAPDVVFQTTVKTHHGRVRDGMAVRLQAFTDRAEARRAAGLD